MHSFVPTTLIFCDYDGVLQTPKLADFIPFEFLSNLEKALIAFPGTGVVVSSSHRAGKTLQDIRQDFSPYLASRVLGATPSLPCGRANAGRYMEIIQWLSSNHHERTPWLALDDEAWLYPKGCERLVQVHPYVGLQDMYLDALTIRLEALAEATGQATFARHQRGYLQESVSIQESENILLDGVRPRNIGYPSFPF
jgi:hypothetical protein